MKVASNRRKPYRRRDAVLLRSQSIKLTRELFKAAGRTFLGIPGMYPIKYWEAGGIVRVFVPGGDQ